MTRKYHIRSGFALARVGINVAAYEFGALHSHQRATVFGFSHRFVGGGKIDYYVGAAECIVNGRRIGYPQIFADFGGYGKGAFVFRAEYKVRAERNRLSAQHDLSHDA